LSHPALRLTAVTQYTGSSSLFRGSVRGPTRWLNSDRDHGSVSDRDRHGGVGRNRRRLSPVWVAREEKRPCSPNWSVISKTVNGFIALGPIPGCRGAASCRPLRSGHPGRLSGHVPALPDPPPRLLECTPNQRPSGNSRLGRPLAKRGGTMALELRAQTRIGYQDPHPEEDGRRGTGSIRTM
jgi:hypothetical protein